MESASFSSYAKAHPEIKFINVTDGGIGFEGIAYKPFSEVVAELSATYDLRGLIHAAISRAQMPATVQEVPARLAALQESLVRVVDHLRVLAGEAKGIPALAEIELAEEEAYQCLFYDAPTLLPQMLRGQSAEGKWKCFLELARKYLGVFASHFPTFLYIQN